MKRLVEHIVKGYLIKETLSRVVYHFTGLQELYNILSTNKFQLNSDMYQSCETYSNKPYYICFTRQYNNNLGYSGKCSVRIHLDGDLLNQQFSGKSVDYWASPYTEYKKKAREAEAQGLYKLQKDYEDYYNSPTTKTNMHKFHLLNKVENEDRLFGDKPIIDNAIKYIKRIDILMSPFMSDEFLMSIKYIAEQRGMVDKLYIFKNQKDFNNPFSKNSFTIQIKSANLYKAPVIDGNDYYYIQTYYRLRIK